MMLSPVSMAKVPFCGTTQTQEVNNIFNRRGKFDKGADKDVVDIKPKKKKSSALKKTLMVAGGLLATAATLVALNKTGALKVLSTTTGAKWYQLAGHYVSKAGEFIAKYTYDPIVNLFK